MNVTATILRPPTTNALDSRQRTRLVRSARKLGAVLGSTPQLVEPISVSLLPIGPSSSAKKAPARRPARLFTSRPSTPNSLYSSSSTNSSAASLILPRSSSETLPEPKAYSTRPRRSKELPRPLVLRLNAVPMPLTDPRVRVQPPTPSTATSARSGTLPVTPTTPVPPPVTEVRRKRMAKLARTLGENIPLDLVFPPSPKSAAPPPPSAPPTAKTRRRRSASVDLGAVAPRSSRIWVTGDNSWIGEWNRRDIREVQQHLRVLKRR